MKFALLLALLSAPAFAKTDFKACKADADCAVAEDPCGKGRPVNKKYLKDKGQGVGQLQTLVGCPEGSVSEAAIYRAVCADKQCTLEKKPAEAPAPKEE